MVPAAAADVVCGVAQSGLCVLDVAGVPFDEALQRVRRAAMTAYNRRGEVGPVRATTSHRTQWTKRWSAARFGGRRPTTAPIQRLFGRVEPDTAGAMRFSTLVDTNLVSLADAEACLRGMEAVAVEVAYADLPAASRSFRA